MGVVGPHAHGGLLGVRNWVGAWDSRHFSWELVLWLALKADGCEVRQGHRSWKCGGRSS